MNARRIYPGLTRKTLLAAIIVLLAALITQLSGQDGGTPSIEFSKPRVLAKTFSGGSWIWFNGKGHLIIAQVINQSASGKRISISVWPSPPDDSGQYDLSPFEIPNSSVTPAFTKDASRIAFVDDVKRKLWIFNTSDPSQSQNVPLKPTKDRRSKVSHLSFTGKAENGLAVLFEDGELQIYDSGDLEDLLNYTWLDVPKNDPSRSFHLAIWGSEQFLYAASYGDKKLYRFPLHENGDFVINASASEPERMEANGIFDLVFDVGKDGSAIFSASNTQLSRWLPDSDKPVILKDIDRNLTKIAIGDKGYFFEVGDFPGINYCDDKGKCELVKIDQYDLILTKILDLKVKGDQAAFYADNNIYHTKFLSGEALFKRPSTEASATASGWIRQNYLPLLLVTILLFLVMIFAFLFNLRTQRWPWTKVQQKVGEFLADSSEYELPLPEVPEGLAKACLDGDCVLFVGAGVSARSGYPVWNDFVRDLVRWAYEEGYIGEKTAQAYYEETNDGNGNLVADNIYSKIEEIGKLDPMYAFLKARFDIGSRSTPAFIRNPLGARKGPNELHRLFKQIGFSGVLTTNFDELLETSYGYGPDDDREVYTYLDTEDLLTSITTKSFFLLKLYGELEKHESLLVAPAQFEEAIGNNKVFSQALQTLFQSRTIFFVGASLEGIETYLKTVSLSRGFKNNHYALVHVTDSAWIAKAEFLNRRYGISVLPYTTDGNHLEVNDFLKTLIEHIASAGKAVQYSEVEVAHLQSIYLKNIGPFDELELNFDTQCNLLLGDNGVGKSTILRAIAVALCGEKALTYAGRLVKARSENAASGTSTATASIKLTTDKNTSYVTDIYLNPKTEEVTITSNTAQPMEAEGWLALGFPPLRSIGWKGVDGPATEPLNKLRPVADDLLPLLTGDPDPRLDNLKQWIVTLDYKSLKERNQPGGGIKHEEVIQKVFDFVNEVIATREWTEENEEKDRTLTYKGVDTKNRILIETNDGPVPLEAVSQGMASLIGWIGVLMQRMYEIYADDEEPLKRYALVLIDEIDAHMHPRWQQHLIPRLKKIFPNAQFLISTHSPLVVGGLPRNEIIRFARNDEGKVEIKEIAADMPFGYMDQILTSDLFGLDSTLAFETQEKIKTYEKLHVKKNRTADEDAEYENLVREMQFLVPTLSNSYEENHQNSLETADLMKKIGDRLNELSPGDGKVMAERGESLLGKIKGGQ